MATSTVAHSSHRPSPGDSATNSTTYHVPTA